MLQRFIFTPKRVLLPKAHFWSSPLESHDFIFPSPIFVSPLAVVPTVQDGRGNPAKVGEGLAFRGSITQVSNT